MADISLVGYNPKKFTELGEAIVTAIEKDGQIITDGLNNGLIIPISKVWYTKEGKSYFTTLADSTMPKTASKIEELYDKFRTAVLEAGIVWSENTRNEQPADMRKIPHIVIQLAADRIEESVPFSGDVIIDVPAAKAIADGLGAVKAQMITDLRTAHGELESSAQFIGGGQADAVNELFMHLVDIVDELFEIIISNSDTGIYANIYKAAQKQEDVASDISTGFRASDTGGSSFGSPNVEATSSMNNAHIDAGQ